MLRIRQTLGRFDGFCAKASGRIVDNPPQPEIIRAVVDYAQIRQHILDFRTVKESGTADDPVGYAISFQRKFQGVGLGIGSIEDGVVPEILPPGAGNNSAGNKIAFRSLIAGFIQGDRIAAAIGGP